jgi:hypothetical protein
VVVLLAPNEIGAVEVEVVVAGATLPVVVVVGDELGDDARVREQARQRRLALLERAPSPPWELVAPGPDLAASRNAREGADDVPA